MQNFVSHQPVKPVLIMAGGTGGHVYPALAVAEYLRDRGVPLFWLGTRQGLEARVVPGNNFQLLTINIGGLRRKGLGGWLLAPLRLSLAILQSLRIMIFCRPGAVLGMGGFVSGPGGVAAWLLRVPLFIHEQNARAGLTNRLLAPLARVVMEGLPGSFGRRRKVRTTGNPVRGQITLLPAPAQRLAGRDPGAVRLLVLGGSQGARALNETIPAALRRLGYAGDIEVWHQTGPDHYRTTQVLYAELALRSLKLEPFIDDMAAAYAWADFVLCRAGALTLAELCVVGLASILVPYPFAADDHQTANARHLSDAGCAILLPESRLTEATLADLLSELCGDRQRLLEMAEKCRGLGRPDAARAVGDTCMEALRV
ncbi:MAG: undecaprenyldiphospho-muramoylpentapeptide beta-N-acetylglucosaminyltransferase [Gammaproteobacteria bacterium]|nr:undecaprenyldiphospho-muramoylpentapeptide beta-N-acetylglucosaminyltransferase [Gammaproteobacteria bacterium]